MSYREQMASGHSPAVLYGYLHTLLPTMISSRNRQTNAFQDLDNARFTPCAEPYFMSIPAIVALLVAVYYLLDHVIPQWRPKWMRPFVKEYHVPQASELPTNEKKPSLRWAIALLAPAVVGCAAETVPLILRSTFSAAAIQPLSWVSISWFGTCL